MEFNFADKMKNAKASAIRETIAKARGENMVSFGGGFPDKDAIPLERIKEISSQVLDEYGLTLFEYGAAQGLDTLLESAKDFLNMDYNVVKVNDDVVITAGSQQALDLVSKVFCDQGDVILVEEPSFLGAFNSFKANGAKLVGIPLEDDGVNLEALEKAMQATPKPKLFYVIPNFANPTGLTTSLEKRKAIYELANKYNVAVLEDNPYGYLRVTGENIPPIKEFDETGIVIYAASLSKIISPGIRCGLLACDKQIVDKVNKAKQVSDNSTNLWAQAIIDKFLRTTDMHQHINKLISIYEKKMNLMLECIEKEFHPSIKVNRPDGGMFIYFNLPDGINVHEFIDAACKEHVAIVAGAEFLTDTSKPLQGVRMNFSTPTPEQIVDGIKRLGKITYQFCE